MRLYIAGPWSHRHQVKDIAARFEQAGHTITEKWWDHPEVSPDDTKELAKQADLDIIGVFDCDHFIFLNLAYSEGKCVELGMALMEDKPILAVGKPNTTVFHHLPELKWVDTVQEAIERLRR